MARLTIKWRPCRTHTKDTVRTTARVLVNQDSAKMAARKSTRMVTGPAQDAPAFDSKVS